ncbi:DUF2865 domain-containing protein [Rhodopseudomonas sp. B29]|uniref:DUF2865 domain-containing protein n=1 Tax=Rhodopseudomonas sp. B29 TaxID=95607 RepID=UPI00034BBCD0|nr:DUF2865 domain-containing protein [Rhodopseudomonas sp. B29]
MRGFVKPVAISAAAIVLVAGAGSGAHAQDFFSALFGGFQAPRPSYAPASNYDRPLPYADDGYSQSSPRMARPAPTRTYASGQAYCVRSCDGRYFPISATGDASKAETCNNLCPSGDTKVVYGSTIDSARTTTGKLYSELPNAFKYRTEIVAGCTCNGKDAFGLAKIDVDNDPTLRKGDIVAGKDGLMVAGVNRRSGDLAFSPAPQNIRAAYEKVRVVARE